MVSKVLGNCQASEGGCTTDTVTQDCDQPDEIQNGKVICSLQASGSFGDSNWGSAMQTAISTAAKTMAQNQTLSVPDFSGRGPIVEVCSASQGFW
jgi:hypothetical protein